MNRVLRGSVGLLAVVCFGITSVAAERPDRPDRPDAKSSVRRAPGTVRSVGSTATGATFGGAGSTAIRGAAWTAENNPIKNANVRLRNVVTGRVEATAVANDMGQFAFENVQAGSYVVELVSNSGNVQVVGHMFSIAPGETVATFVRTGAKVPFFNGFFGNTVQSVTSSAASEGVTAIAPVARSVTSKQ